MHPDLFFPRRLRNGHHREPQRRGSFPIRAPTRRITTSYDLSSSQRLLNNAGTSSSPWVIAIKDAGIGGLPSVINVVVLLSAFVRRSHPFRRSAR